MARIAGLAFVFAAALAVGQQPARSADIPGWTNGGMQLLHLRPSLVSSAGKPVAFDPDKVGPRSRHVYEFRLLPGTFGLSGAYRRHILQALTLEGEFRADVASWTRKATPSLAPLPWSPARSLRISPEDTRIGQIAPLVVRPSMSRINIPPQLGRTDYFADHEGRRVLLVVFDRPCSIQGTWKLGNHSFEADVQVRQPGLYALTVVEDEAGNGRVVLAPALDSLDIVTVLDS